MSYGIWRNEKCNHLLNHIVNVVSEASTLEKGHRFVYALLTTSCFSTVVHTCTPKGKIKWVSLYY